MNSVCVHRLVEINEVFFRLDLKESTICMEMIYTDVSTSLSSIASAKACYKFIKRKFFKCVFV